MDDLFYTPGWMRKAAEELWARERETSTVLLFSLFSQKLLLVGFSLILKILDKHLQKLRHRNVVLPGYFSQYIHIRFMSPDRQLFFGWISLIWHFLGLSKCSKNTSTSPDN